MNKVEKIKLYYEPKLEKGLPDYQVLGWENEEAQKRRFEILVSNVELEGRKILDVGCGLGNLNQYLNSSAIKVNYTGVDISGRMIESAVKRNPEGRFKCCDIFEGQPFGNEMFDIVYTSGIFNLNLGNNKEFLINALCRFHKLCSDTLVFNLLHSSSPGREDKYFYFLPEEVKELVEGLPCKYSDVRIIEQYLDNDFTVICKI